jgi:hypothetical protein
MTPGERRAAVGRLSATLALRPDADQVRLRRGTEFITHRDDLWPAGEPAATPEWIAANVDGMIATLERLYALAAEDEHPGVGTFHYRMSWLPPLLAELEQGQLLDG